MNTSSRFLALLAALVLAAAPAAHALFTVGNVRVAQRVGTKLVDIDYDITGIAAPVSVSLEISSDGGATWTVPAVTVTGAVGNTVTPGTNLRITWNAGVDWNTQISTQTKFRVSVDDLVPDVAVFSLIPVGGFGMGDAQDVTFNGTDAPPHTVYVSAFHMQKNLVTKENWDAVRTWGQAHGYTDLGVGQSKATNHPVVASWYDEVKWCNARSEKDGLTPCYYTDTAQSAVYRAGNTDLANTMVKWTANGYRLPTEAEWEKAARGGLSGERFPWGAIISHTYANFWNSHVWGYSSGTQGYHPIWGQGTSPVGSFAANGYGLFDTAGNAPEWCWDWYAYSYYSTGVTDPHGPASGMYRVYRGGGWGADEKDCRVANRLSYLASSAASFRPVRRAVP